MAISQYSRPVQAARFNPMTMQEMMALPAALEERHNSTIKAIEEMRSNEMVREQDAGDYAKIQDHWNGRMNSAVDDIMQNGILAKPHTNFVMSQRKEREQLYDPNRGPVGMMLRMKAEQDKEHAAIDANTKYAPSEKEYFKQKNAESRGRTIGQNGEPQYTKGWMPASHVDVEDYFTQNLQRTGYIGKVKEAGYNVTIDYVDNGKGEKLPYLVLTDKSGTQVTNAPNLQAMLDKINHDINSPNTEIGAYIRDSNIWNAEAALKSANYLFEHALKENETPDNNRLVPLWDVNGGSGSTTGGPTVTVTDNPSIASVFNVPDTFRYTEPEQVKATMNSQLEKQAESTLGSDPHKVQEIQQKAADQARSVNLMNAQYEVVKPLGYQAVQNAQGNVQTAIANMDKSSLDGEPIIPEFKNQGAEVPPEMQEILNQFEGMSLEDLAQLMIFSNYQGIFETTGGLDLNNLRRESFKPPNDVKISDDIPNGTFYKDANNNFGVVYRDSSGEARIVPLNKTVTDALMDATKGVRETYLAAIKERKKWAEQTPFATDRDITPVAHTTKDQSALELETENFYNTINPQLFEVTMMTDDEGKLVKLKQENPRTYLEEQQKIFNNMKARDKGMTPTLHVSKFGNSHFTVSYTYTENGNKKSKTLYLKPKYNTGNKYAYNSYESFFTSAQSLMAGSPQSWMQWQSSLPELYYNDVPLTTPELEVNQFEQVVGSTPSPLSGTLSTEGVKNYQAMTGQWDPDKAWLGFGADAMQLPGGKADEVYKIIKNKDGQGLTYNDIFFYVANKLGRGDQAAMQTVLALMNNSPAFQPQDIQSVQEVIQQGQTPPYMDNEVLWPTKGQMMSQFTRMMEQKVSQ